MTFDTRLAIADGAQPVFLRIADAVVREITRGRLRAGDPLPGTRRLAEQLGVHRNTVIAAMSELRAQAGSRPGPAGRPGWPRSPPRRAGPAAAVRASPGST